MFKITTIIEYIIAIFIALDYFSIYFYNPLFGLANVPVVVICILLVVLLFVQPMDDEIDIYPILYYLIPVIIFLVSSRFHRAALLSMNYIVLVPLFYIYFSKKDIEEKHSLLYKFSDVMCVFASSSLVLWILVFVTGILETNMSIPDEWADPRLIESFNLIQFNTQAYVVLGEEIVRNTFCYEEGPVYNMVLCTALSIELYLRENINKIKIAILSIAIISTLTTTGLFFLLGSLFVYAFLVATSENVIFKYIKMGFPVLLYLGYLLSVNIIADKKDASTSYDTRTRTIYQMMNTFFDNMFVGIGYKKYKLEVSNSLFHMLAEGGLNLFIVYFVAYICKPVLWFINTGDKKSILFFLSYVFLFILTTGYDCAINLMLIAFSLSCLSLKMDESSKDIGGCEI